ncbi:MAG TPA: translational GTPase TypA, partial [Clostridiales bacterium]|nr:translational GTPase TypA [Clostridiales bacterium]
PGEKVYEGMIIGMNSRGEDITVNPCKLKKQSNIRSSAADEAIKLSPPKIMTLEAALEFINDDELVEITPDAIRIRKRYLTEIERRKQGNKLKTGN